jgi:anti-sigma factor RsiW
MNATKEQTPSDIEMLLPWHAAGTLSHSDSERVAAALASDPELARRYAMVRDELGETIVLNETLGAPSARAMNELFAKIDAEPARKPSVSIGIAARMSGFFASLAPRTLAYAGAAAVLAIVLQAGFIASVMIKETSPGGYVTASAPSAVTPSVGSVAMIRFSPQATLDDVNKFLFVNKFSIVSGPANGGFYTVRLADKPLPKAELATIAKKLREDKLINFLATVE